MLTSGLCYIHCINIESESRTSILFTGLESQMENTDSVNELSSCVVISPTYIHTLFATPQRGFSVTKGIKKIKIRQLK